MYPATCVDWGILDYQESLSRQRELLIKRQNDECEDVFVVVEHPHVITLGRSKKALKNVLAASGVPVVEVERGGDVTYHGPGQIVIYPILKLREEEQDLHLFLRNMESGIIRFLARYKVEGGREEGKTGVWCSGRKLASLGIACRQWVILHGLALNITTDLRYFSRINPCGFSAGIMSSLGKELENQKDETTIDMSLCKVQLVEDVSLQLGRISQRLI